MTIMTKPNQVFGTILVSPDNKILLVKGRKSGKWSFPKGHPIKNEEEIQCAIRETHEETGIYIDNSWDTKLHLATGNYYVYYMKQKKTPEPEDDKEVTRADWWSLREIEQLPYNIDISYFLRHHSRDVLCY